MGQQTQQTPANINRLQKHKQTSEWHSRIVQSNPLPSPPATPPSQCYHPLRPRLPSNTPTQSPVHRGRASLPSTPENFPFFVLPPSLSLPSLAYLGNADQFGTCPTNPIGPSGRNHNMPGPSTGCSGGKAPLLWRRPLQKTNQLWSHTLLFL